MPIEPERFIIDSNIFDKIIDEEGMLELVERLTDAGAVSLLSTHVQRDELLATPDVERRRRLLSVPVEPVPTFGFVVGVSRVGEARLGPSEPFETARAGESWEKRTNDALISMTAQFEQATLVSEDKGLRDRAQAIPTVRVWQWVDLREALLSLSNR